MQLCTRLFLVLSIGLIGLASVQLAVSAAEENNQAIISLAGEILTGKKTPDQVYELLEKIQQVYASLDINDMSSHDRQRKKNYDILTAAWNPTTDQCNEAEFSRRDDFKERTLFEANHRAYWQHCEQKLIQLCEPILEGQMKAEIDKVDPEAEWRPLAKLLVDSIKSESSLPYFEIPASLGSKKKTLVAGVLKYLETTQGPLNKSVLKVWGGSRDRFTFVFFELTHLCDSIVATGMKQVKIFDIMQQRNNASWKPTGFIKEKMEAVKICLDVYSLKPMDPTFKLLQERNRGKGCLGLGRHV